MLKKALLVGINAYAAYPLRGCVNDVKAMKELLMSLYDFKEDDILLIADKEATLKGIVDGLGWLAEGGDDKGVRVFHYAGHGHLVPDENGDEPDGADEAVVSHDYKTKGYLIDDELKKLYDRFPTNGNLTLIMDACHFGTNQRGPGGSGGTDVMYRFIPNTYAERKNIVAAKKKFHEAQREFVMREVKEFAKVRGRDIEFEQRINSAMQKFEKLRFGDVSVREGNVLLAACQSDQQAADAKFGGAYHGAFTHSLVKILKETHGKITYRDLIEKVAKTLNDQNFSQVPQLECFAEKETTQMFSSF